MLTTGCHFINATSRNSTKGPFVEDPSNMSVVKVARTTLP